LLTHVFETDIPLKVYLGRKAELTPIFIFENLFSLICPLHFSRAPEL
jgi:hypothetical protein